MKEIVHQIKEWESRAKNVVVEAEKEAQRIIARARDEVKQLRLMTLREAEDIRGRILDKAEKEALVEAKRIQEEGTRRLEQVRLLRKENMPHAVDLIVERMLEVDAGS